MNIGLIFDTLLVRPIVTILLGIYQGLAHLNIPYALGFSIIFLTIVIRFLLYPVISSQIRSSKKMSLLAPSMKKLREKYGKDPKRMQAETMKLYKEHGVNPASGCLPVILQLPVIWALYSVLQHVITLKPHLIVAEVNKQVYLDAFKLTSPWDVTFFGIALSGTPAHFAPAAPFIIPDLIAKQPLVALVPFITGFLQFILSKMMVPQETPERKKDTKNKEQDMQSAMSGSMLFMFPLMIGFFALTLPIGLSLYWNTFTIFGIIQQYKILGLGGLSSWKDKLLLLKK